MIRRDAHGRPMMSGAPQRDALVVAPTNAPVGGIQTTRYQRGQQNLGPPVSVIDVSEFPQGAVTLSGTLAVANTDLLVSTQTAQPRRCMVIRNSENSPAGSYLYVSFGTTASAQNSWFSIAQGGIVFLDTVVPQDDVHLAGSVAGVIYIFGYVTYPVPQQQTQPLGA